MKFFVLALYLLFVNVNANNLEFIVANDSSSNLSTIKTFEGDIVTLNASLAFYANGSTSVADNYSLNCKSDYLKVGILLNWTDILLPVEANRMTKIDFPIIVLSKRLGGSNITCSVLKEGNSTKFLKRTMAVLIVSRNSTIAELIFRILVSIFVIFLTFVMGCGLDPKIIVQYFKIPLSPFIGFCSQFIFMPLISAGLGKISNIGVEFGLGLLVIGCSPGGGASNIWTVLFGGDLNLSMTMTFISSCAALVMMPFWMFVLGRFFIDPKMVIIPYGSIALNLLQVVVPAAMGMGFRWKWKHAAEILVKKVKLLGLLFVIFIFTYGTYANLYIYQLIGDYPYLLPIGALLPWLGFIFGFILALITRRSKPQAIAIALETGFQNIGIAILILKFSMPQPSGDLGSVMPLIVAIFTPFPLYFAYAGMVIKKKCFTSKKEKDVELKIQVEDQSDSLINSSPSD